MTSGRESDELLTQCKLRLTTEAISDISRGQVTWHTSLAMQLALKLTQPLITDLVGVSHMPDNLDRNDFM